MTTLFYYPIPNNKEKFFKGNENNSLAIVELARKLFECTYTILYEDNNPAAWCDRILKTLMDYTY